MGKRKSEHEKLIAEIDKVVARIKKIKAVYEPKLAAERGRLEALRKLCKHPNISHYNIGYDSGSHCPDCGMSS